MTEVLERCIRPSVQTAKRSAKFLSNPGKIVRCIAGTAFPSIKIAVAKKLLLGREFIGQSGEISGFRTDSRTLSK
jgi:hypothetical protein